MEEEIECFGCKSYYLYYSRKGGDYVITSNSLEAFDGLGWIPLEDEKISDLIKLLQKHEELLEKHKDNLSANGKEAKMIKLTDYLSKQDEELIDRIIKIAEHLPIKNYSEPENAG